MYCDYNALADYATVLNNKFNDMRKAMNSIENSMKTITSLDTWDAPTRDYYLDMYQNVLNNFDTLSNKILNIIHYIDSVIDNYKSFDNSVSAYFGG